MTGSVLVTMLASFLLAAWLAWFLWATVRPVPPASPPPPATATPMARGRPVLPPARPVPPADPSPKGVRVVLIYDRASLAAGQAWVLHDVGLMTYLHDHTAGWWICDASDPTTYDRPDLKAVLAWPRGSSPWLVVTRAPGGDYAGPLPATSAEVIALLKRLGI